MYIRKFWVYLYNVSWFWFHDEDDEVDAGDVTSSRVYRIQNSHFSSAWTGRMTIRQTEYGPFLTYWNYLKSVGGKKRTNKTNQFSDSLSSEKWNDDIETRISKGKK